MSHPAAPHGRCSLCALPNVRIVGTITSCLACDLMLEWPALVGAGLELTALRYGVLPLPRGDDPR